MAAVSREIQCFMEAVRGGRRGNCRKMQSLAKGLRADLRQRKNPVPGPAYFTGWQETFGALSAISSPATLKVKMAFRSRNTPAFVIPAIFLATSQLLLADWPQDGGNAQRTGWTDEEPALPWKFAWAWNGPDAKGGASEHRHHQPEKHRPWEARVCAGGGYVLAPSGKSGLFALRAGEGTIAWQFNGGICQATPAMDIAAGVVFAGTMEGKVVKLKLSSGTVLGEYATESALSKSLLLARDRILALTARGVLHSVDAATMQPVWRYDSGRPPGTPPAWSEKAKTVVFGQQHVMVHCVDSDTGKQRWKMGHSPWGQYDGEDVIEFDGGWPVIAEEHGVVFLRQVHSGIDKTLWSGGGPKGRWPATNAEIQKRLETDPFLRNLFAIRLADGHPAFLPCVGHAGTEDLKDDGKPRLRVPCLPVVRKTGGREVAYTQWRNGDTRDPSWDGRWDSHLGEMVLDNDTVPGMHAGYLRFVQFAEHGGWMHITDESCPLTMAGETIFHAHWDASFSARITDRSPSLGLMRSAPVKTERHPPVARHLRLPPDKVDAATHWHGGAMNLMDGRYLDGPGWWTYANALDPPTPARNAYSEGILPRITIVACGLVIVQGNGGELLALRHSGKQ
jgi:hypothetical protein